MIASDQEDADAGGSEIFIVSKGLAKPLSELREYFQRNSTSMARDLVDEGSVAILKLEDCVHNNDIKPEIYLEVQNVLDQCSKFEIERMNLSQKKILLNIQTSILDVVDQSRNHQNHENVEDKDQDNQLMNKDDDSSNNKQNVKIIKREFTRSLVHVEQEHQCPHCVKTFLTYSSLHRHCRKQHRDQTNVSKKDFTERDYIICLLNRRNKPTQRCNAEVEKGRICRHLKLTHQVQKPDKNEFKGFLTEDSGTSYRVHWGSSKEANPPDVQYIEVEIEPERPPADDENIPPEEDPLATTASVEIESDRNKSDEQSLSKNPPTATDASTNEVMNFVEVAVAGPSRKNTNYVEDLEESIKDQSIDLPIVSPILFLVNPTDVTNSSSFGSLSNTEEVSMEEDSQKSFITGAMTETGPTIHLKCDENLMNEISPSKDQAASHNTAFDGDLPEYESPLIVKFKKKDGAWAQAQEESSLTDDSEDDSDDDGDFAEVENEFEEVVTVGVIEYTQLRHQRRNLIESTQELSNKEGNKEIIAKFTDWWRKAGASFVTVNKDTSTIVGSLNMLFLNKDCFLNHQTLLDNSFNLSRLVKFTSPDYLAIPSPIEWITKVGGSSGQEMPSRRIDMLKSYIRLLGFIHQSLTDHGFIGDQIQQKQAVESHLAAIRKLIQDKKLFAQLQKLYQTQTAKKEQMLQILKPFEAENLHNCVKNWYRSKACEDLEIEAIGIYTKAKELESVTSTNFNRFSKIVLLELAVFDKSRVGVYECMTNQDFVMKKPTWIPADMDSLEFAQLPKDWVMYKAPSPGVPPSSYEMTILADRSGIKCNQKQTVIINERVFELIEKMMDLKDLLFGADEWTLESPLFVSHSGRKLPRLQNYAGKGSLLHLFGEATGLQKFTLKMLRKAAEGYIQSSSELQKDKHLNYHSSTVGKKVYDKMNGARRNVFLTNLGKQDFSYSLRGASKVGADLEKERRAREESQKKKLTAKAVKYLDDLKKIQPWDLRPSSVNDKEILLLKSVFGNGSQDDNCWVDTFYKEVDSQESSTLRQLEEKIYRNSRDQIIKKLKGTWVGSKTDNSVADIIVSSIAKRYVEK